MIKFFFIILVSLFLGMSLPAQSIKKVSIIELERYIKKSEHPLLVNFWATYCKPCIAEIPYFQKEISKYKNAELLLVSLDLPDAFPDKIVSFVREKNFKSTLLWLNETNADYFCPKIDKSWSGAIPSSFFVNNKTNYRRFFERQLTPQQVQANCRAMVKD